MNNRQIIDWLFPKHASGGNRPFLDSLSRDTALRATGRMLGAAERAIISFVAALPVVDVAFVLLVVAYVKAS